MIVVDTHVLIWWIKERARLSESALHAIDRVDRVGVPAIACWEIALLAERQRVVLAQPLADWLENLFTLSRMALLPLAPAVAATAATFQEVLRDPVDCLVAATAKVHDAPLVTADRRIRSSALVTTIW